MAIQDFFEPFVIVEKVGGVSDGMGGFMTEFIESEPFMASIVLDSSTEMRIAEKQGVTSKYTFTTNKNVNLKYMSVVKCVSSGLYYRLTSNVDEMMTPKLSLMSFKQCQAESWEKPI